MWGKSCLELFCSPGKASPRKSSIFKASPCFLEVGRLKSCSNTYIIFNHRFWRNKVWLTKHFSGSSCSVFRIEAQLENHLSSKLGRNFGGGGILRKNSKHNLDIPLESQADQAISIAQSKDSFLLWRLASIIEVGSYQPKKWICNC